MSRRTRCHGTKRYALRCKLLARPGCLTCGRHASQEEYWQLNLNDEEKAS